MSTTGPADPNIEPPQVPGTGTDDPNGEAEQRAPVTDVASAPALQPRDGDGDMLS